MHDGSLWSEASRNVSKEHTDRALHGARVQLAPLWPFLAKAASVNEYHNRKAIIADRIEKAAADHSNRNVAYGDLHRELHASLDRDFTIVRQADGSDTSSSRMVDDHKSDDEKGDSDGDSSDEEDDSGDKKDSDDDGDDDSKDSDDDSDKDDDKKDSDSKDDSKDDQSDKPPWLKNSVRVVGGKTAAEELKDLPLVGPAFDKLDQNAQDTVMLGNEVKGLTGMGSKVAGYVVDYTDSRDGKKYTLNHPMTNKPYKHRSSAEEVVDKLHGYGHATNPTIREAAKSPTSLSEPARKKDASEGDAEPDGSYPIKNKTDLKNAEDDLNRTGRQPKDVAWVDKKKKQLGSKTALDGVGGADTSGVGGPSAMPDTNLNPTDMSDGGAVTPTTTKPRQMPNGAPSNPPPSGVLPMLPSAPQPGVSMGGSKKVSMKLPIECYACGNVDETDLKRIATRRFCSACGSHDIGLQGEDEVQHLAALPHTEEAEFHDSEDDDRKEAEEAGRAKWMSPLGSKTPWQDTMDRQRQFQEYRNDEIAVNQYERNERGKSYEESMNEQKKTAGFSGAGYYIITQFGTPGAGPFATPSMAEAQLAQNRGGAIQYLTSAPVRGKGDADSFMMPSGHKNSDVPFHPAGDMMDNIPSFPELRGESEPPGHVRTTVQGAKTAADMTMWIVTLNHDEGTVRIKTNATSAEQAKSQVLSSEGAPPSAVVSVEPEGKQAKLDSPEENVPKWRKLMEDEEEAKPKKANMGAEDRPGGTEVPETVPEGHLQTAPGNSTVVWDAEHGWHNGPRANTYRDENGRMKIDPIKASKIQQIAHGILSTNPGMLTATALRVATQTVERYPNILKDAVALEDSYMTWPDMSLKENRDKANKLADEAGE